MSAKSLIVRKAGKATVNHAVSGTVSKARRQPMRATTLLGLGGLLGAIGGFLAARRAAPTPPPAPMAPPPTIA